MPIFVKISGFRNDEPTFGRELFIVRIATTYVEGGSPLCTYRVEVVTGNNRTPYHGKTAEFTHWYMEDVYSLTTKAIEALKKAHPEVERW